MATVLDTHGRPLTNLRLSVTDRCNLRCGYCMPEEVYTWLPKRDVLTYEEHVALATALVPHGLRKVRLTGGEPLIRRDLQDLVQRLAAVDGLDDLAMTTNAIFLVEAGDGPDGRGAAPADHQPRHAPRGSLSSSDEA